jgi:hypothetical protein
LFDDWLVTTTTIEPFFPPLRAVIVALPAPCPVTTPVEDTVATRGLLDAHETARSTTPPSASIAVAVNMARCEIVICAVVGVTTTAVTVERGGVADFLVGVAFLEAVDAFRAAAARVALLVLAFTGTVGCGAGASAARSGVRLDAVSRGATTTAG